MTAQTQVAVVVSKAIARPSCLLRVTHVRAVNKGTKTLQETGAPLAIEWPVEVQA